MEEFLSPFEAVILKKLPISENCNPGAVQVIQALMREKLRIVGELAASIYNSISTEKVKLEVKQSLGDLTPEEFKSSSLVYGDIDFNSFANILIRADVQKNDVFVDLGSGTGRAVVYATLLMGDKLKKSYGIEILPLLHEYAMKGIESMHQKFREQPDLFQYHLTDTSVEKGDFLDDNNALDWSTSADIVFINSTAFSEVLFSRIQSKAECFKEGMKVITLTRCFSSPCFEIIDTVNYTMSWGLATCYFHIRL